mmetsp:Transcript_80281/g.233124  ORF Transcript_80281/g.233124 Transcript_80281/m.233124 type:complete len:200 (-) Transcript_80281:1824-2423(-)
METLDSRVSVAQLDLPLVAPRVGIGVVLERVLQERPCATREAMHARSVRDEGLREDFRVGGDEGRAIQLGLPRARAEGRDLHDTVQVERGRSSAEAHSLDDRDRPQEDARLWSDEHTSPHRWQQVPNLRRLHSRREGRTGGRAEDHTDGQRERRRDLRGGPVTAPHPAPLVHVARHFRRSGGVARESWRRSRRRVHLRR